MQNLGISASTPILEIWNKIDSIEPGKKKKLENIAKRRLGVCCLSALNGEGISDLKELIENSIVPQKFYDTLFVPFEFGDKKAWLHEHGVVINEFFTEDGFKFEVMWSAKQKAKYYSFTQ